MKANEWEVMKFFPWMETCRHLRMFSCFIIIFCLIFVWFHHDAWYSSDDLHEIVRVLYAKRTVPFAYESIAISRYLFLKSLIYLCSTDISNYVRYIFPLIMKTDCYNFCYRPVPWHSAFGNLPKYKNVVDFYSCFVIIKVLIRSEKLKKNYYFK